MSSDLVQIYLLAFSAMLNPTLLAAVTVMLLLPSPRRLMLGYLLGAYLTSITSGLVIVYTLQGTSFVSTSRNTVGPGQDLAIGGILLLVAFVLGTGRDEPVRERRQRRKAEKAKDTEPKEPWAQRMLGRGSARITFAVGLLLSFPGVSYFIALGRMASLDAAVAPTVLLVVSFCLIELLLLEVPLLGYFFAPASTADRVARFRAWVDANGRRAGIVIAGVLGAALVLRGLIELL
jgi:Sap, sulfolipid-1-addressing protein